MHTGHATWSAVDSYTESLLVPPDKVLEGALRNAASAGMPPINVSPAQGQFLRLLAESVRAQRILEVGTLAGYSAIWLARALPSHGRLVTIEIDPKHAAVAAGNIDRAGLTDRVDIRLGSALEILPQLAADGHEPFDFVFIDADKQNIPAYFEWALKLSHTGTMIIVDNVVRDGEVINAHSQDPSVQGVRALNNLIANNPHVEATTIQTVGTKGYDGFTLAVVGGAT
jgi:predicted O-methyltransferase YrrM